MALGLPHNEKERAGSPRSDRKHAGWSSRGYLPHYDAAGEYQHIIFRLNDALSSEAVETCRAAMAWDRLAAFEHFLDQGFGMSTLRDRRVALIVARALLRFDGERYRLLAWCVMPNHVHVLVEQFTGWPLSAIVHSWKLFTASKANLTLKRKGRFWAPDYFDHAMRHEDQTNRTIEYVEANPVKAGLCAAAEAWPWSSAGWRAG